MSSSRGRLLIVVCAGVYAAGALVSACSTSKSSAPPAPQAQVKTPAAAALWGDMAPIVSVKELMRDFIDPASDYIFDSVATVVEKGKVIERQPRTDEDWDRIRAGAVMLAEGAYLLKVPRPFAPPGDENNSTGPDPEELSPAQIRAKLEKDPVLWNAKIEALRNVGREVLEIVKKRDVNELWDASDNLDQACENCHLEYWYPGEKAFLNKLDRKLVELYGGRSSKALGMTVK
ncbi:MAG TPA: hypothetical protein VFA27_04705 [Vicinamibacterales bacterium]|nr:hypothetical protein [Vicinamibacterales bacterium]